MLACSRNSYQAGSIISISIFETERTRKTPPADLSLLSLRSKINFLYNQILITYSNAYLLTYDKKKGIILSCQRCRTALYRTCVSLWRPLKIKIWERTSPRCILLMHDIPHNTCDVNKMITMFMLLCASHWLLHPLRGYSLRLSNEIAP